MTNWITSFNNNTQTHQLSTSSAEASTLGNTGTQIQSWSGNVGGGFSFSLQQQLMQLIMQLLQQIMQPPTKDQPAQPSNPDTSAPEAEPVTIGLTASESKLLAAGLSDPSHPASQVVVQDGANQDGRLSVGDTVLLKDSNGNTIKEQQLTKDDLYNLRFRENMLKNTESIDSGWKFTDELVNLRGATLGNPEARLYTDKAGQVRFETVLERNDFWEVVERDNNRYLLMRTENDQGQTILASDALTDIFQNRDDYQFDCASPMPLLNLKSTLDTIGADDFNKNAGQLLLSSWTDQYDQSGFDGGYISTVRHAQAGEITVDGVSNLAGETAMFDPAQGDKLVAGNVYYFDLPGDTQTAVQGWNAVYLGEDDAGGHNFWSNSIGTVNVSFKDGSYVTSGDLSGYYLGAVVSNPNAERMQQWDDDQSVLR